MYSVYILTVKDGRKYIGATSMKPKTRWNHGNGYRHIQELWEIICGDGWESVSAEVVASGLTEEDASILEQTLIEEYQTIDPRRGFNKEGGGIGKHRMILDSTREKMRQEKLGELNNNYGKRFSAEHKQRIAESNRGQKRTEETRRKIGKAKEKAVSQYTLNGDILATYESGKTAAQITGVPAYAISRVCRGVRRQEGGYIWKFTNE